MNTYVARFFGTAMIVFFSLTSSAGADAPAGHYTVTAGTVYDTKTKLTWQRVVPPSAYTWADAKAYCAGETLGGNRWRLPTRNELLTIVDFSRSNPSIDPTAFPSTPTSVFWSSSPLAGSSSFAWTVYFMSGPLYSNSVSDALNVRCVRSERAL